VIACLRKLCAETMSSRSRVFVRLSLSLSLSLSRARARARARPHSMNHVPVKYRSRISDPRPLRGSFPRVQPSLRSCPAGFNSRGLAKNAKREQSVSRSTKSHAISIFWDLAPDKKIKLPRRRRCRRRRCHRGEARS